MKVHGSKLATEYKTPSKQGEVISLIFSPQFNADVRIHLQYKSGDGQIMVSEVKIHKVS